MLLDVFCLCDMQPTRPIAKHYLYRGTRCCRVDGCTMRSSFGLEGGRKAEFCSKHAKASMINVITKRCHHLGCATQASFGVEGSRRRELCSRHAKNGMINVDARTCGHTGCATQASFGVPVEGTKKREFVYGMLKRAWSTFAGKYSITKNLQVSRVLALFSRTFCVYMASPSLDRA